MGMPFAACPKGSICCPFINPVSKHHTKYSLSNQGPKDGQYVDPLGATVGDDEASGELRSPRSPQPQRPYVAKILGLQNSDSRILGP